VKNLLLTFLLACFSFCATGQVTIQGIVKDDQGIVVSDALLMVIKDGDKIFNFAASDAQGRYSIQHSSQDDSLQIRISRLDYATQVIKIANCSQQLDFTLIQQPTVLKEVEIRSQGAWRSRDTVNYPVSGFANESDRTIADVLRKLPGIEVRQSGQILYNDKPINRFYVEGMDLMGGRYNVISDNLRHDAIQTVQILEDHEPIKALEEVSLSDRAALNLILKEDARAKWQATAKLGLGFAPLLWDEELTMMRFAKATQDVIVYKTNNIGVNADRELMAHYGVMSGGQNNDLLTIPLSSSGISENRTLFNNQHMLTANRLIKLNDVYQLRLNGSYLNDRQERNSSTHLVYFLDGTEIITDEQTHTKLNINRADLTLTLTGNHQNYFFENALKIQGDWRNTFADISSSEQRLKNQSFNISDNFRWLKVFGKKRLDIESSNRLSSAPQSLVIKPGLYADFFNNGISYDQLKQEADLLEFKSNTAVIFSNTRGRWQTNYELGLDLTLQQLNSDLSIPDQATADTLRNEFAFTLAHPYIAARYSYVRRRLTATLNLPFGYAIQQNTDKLTNHSNSEATPYINPSLSLRYKIGYVWEVSSTARYSNSFNTINSLHTGYLLSDYRNISRNSGEFFSRNSQSYGLGLSYNEPIKSINARLWAGYDRTGFDKITDVDFDGILSIRKLVESKGFNDSKRLGLSFSKGFSRYITKTALFASYGISTGQQQQHGTLITSESNFYNIVFTLDGRISSSINFIYGINYNNRTSRIEGVETTNPGTISGVTQNFRINVLPMKALTLGLIANHSQSITASNLPSTFFMDLRAQYKYKRFEFSANWNNILNANQYVIANYGDFFSSINTFELRPTNMVLAVRFSFL
jgi:hypothetical protein